MGRRQDSHWVSLSPAIMQRNPTDWHCTAGIKTNLLRHVCIRMCRVAAENRAGFQVPKGKRHMVCLCLL